MTKKPHQIVCCLVLDEGGRILLLQRHKKAFGAGLWAPPGGKPGHSETAEDALRREVLEETRIKLGIVDYLGEHEIVMPHGTARMETFKSNVSWQTEVLINKDEHQDYKWFNVDELINHEKIIWGLPTVLDDFKLIEGFKVDPTLADGSQIRRIE